jgi:hypothetical protein
MRTWVYATYSTAPKHAIRDIFHAVELLLKERLAREHRLLVYRDIDRPIGDESPTVGLDQVLWRFHNLGVALSDDDVTILKDLRRRRNRIEHHSFVPDASHKHVVGKALRFIYYFLPEHLGTSLEEVMADEEDLYKKAREEILSFEELLEEAEEKVAQLTSMNIPGDGGAMGAWCPDCANFTMVIGSEKGNYCFLCDEEKEVGPCDTCGEYVAKSELVYNGMCGSCSDAWR